jgi:hypothetical protein
MLFNIKNNKNNPDLFLEPGLRTNQISLIKITGHQCFLYLSYGFGDLDLTRAGKCTVKNSMTAGNSHDFIQYLQSFRSSLVAAVKNETMGIDNGRWSQVFVTCPK